MPTIDISYKDLCSLIGKKIPIQKLREEGILYAKGEIEETKGDQIKIDIKDTNRPDLWSTEGIARELRGRYVSGGIPKYKVEKSNLVVNVDRSVSKVRPLTVCAVVTGLKITDAFLSQIVQLQEKVSVTFGRGRREVAIGVYDLNRIKPPIEYKTVKPDGIKFVPLEFNQKLTPRELLQKHPKGKEFGHLLRGCPEYPMFIDSAGEVLSIPPIINSNYTGKVTKSTKDVFIECSGFDFRFLKPALNTIVAAMADRGGKIKSVNVCYSNRVIHTPDLTPKRTKVSLDYTNKISGLNLKIKEAARLLEKARYETKIKGNEIELLYPAYRQDIMHQVDAIEDILISYGYNRIQPVIPELPTIGAANKLEKFSGDVAEIMTGLGLQEILSYTLTNRETLFAKMNLPETKTVEISNIISSRWSVFRNYLLPGLLEFLSRNKHNEYPQEIFEIGDVVIPDPRKETRTRDVRKLGMLLSGNAVGYEDASSRLDALMKNLGIDYKLKKLKHHSFIPGRAARILIKGKEAGIIGEINPPVLENFGLEKPVVGFELNLSHIFELLS